MDIAQWIIKAKVLMKTFSLAGKKKNFQDDKKFEGWERKRSKCFITYIYLDLFRSQLQIISVNLGTDTSTWSEICLLAFANDPEANACSRWPVAQHWWLQPTSSFHPDITKNDNGHFQKWKMDWLFHLRNSARIQQVNH